MASSRKKLPPRGFAKLLGKDFLELSNESLEEAKGPSKKKSITEKYRDLAKGQSQKTKRSSGKEDIRETTSEPKTRTTKAVKEPTEQKITTKAAAPKKTRATTKAK